MNNNLDEQLSRLIDGLLSPAEQAEVEAILLRDPAARELYRLYVATHIELADHPREPTVTHARDSRKNPFFIISAIAAAITLCFGTWWLTRSNLPSGSQPPIAVTNAPDAPTIAVTAQFENASWNLSTSLAPGAKLQAGELELTSGLVVLDLIGGQRLTLKAPARVNLLSEKEMLLHHGDAALRVMNHGDTYVIRVPGGAVVDLGTEISIKVDEAGHSDVRVFEGLANASVVDAVGRTRQERLLKAGDSVRISETLEASQSATDSFLRSPAGSQMDRSPAGDEYADAIATSAPDAWWRFETMHNPITVAPSAGDAALVLHGTPKIVGSDGGRFLLTDENEAAGFAMPVTALPDFEPQTGFSVEMLIYPLSENYATVLALDQPTMPLSEQKKLNNHVNHPPQRFLIERTSTCGSRIGHIHPDYSIRAMMRSPAGYEGGVNTYSSDSHLLRRWIHLAFTYDGRNLRLYVDGELSDHTEANLPFQQGALRPIIGRLQPAKYGEQRQWHGGIDEVALYQRVLDATEIKRHASALRP